MRDRERMLKLGLEADDLRRRLREAFPLFPLPDQGDLVDGDDDEALGYVNFVEDKTWSDFSPVRPPMAVPVVFYLRPSAFRYFLPSYLRTLIEEPYEDVPASTLGIALLPGLDRRDASRLMNKQTMQNTLDAFAPPWGANRRIETPYNACTHGIITAQTTMKNAAKHHYTTFIDCNKGCKQRFGLSLGVRELWLPSECDSVNWHVEFEPPYRGNRFRFARRVYRCPPEIK